jgi:predicted nucleic acid-binding protein
VLYFDTSFLTPLILEEPTSARIERFVVRLPAGELAVSHWTRVEFSSLLAREVRMGGLDDRAAEAADAQFEAVVRESFVVFLPNAGDFDLAKKYLGTHGTGLRAGDALHLAIATSRRAEAIYSLDKTLLKAGEILGLPVSAGVRSAKTGGTAGRDRR